MLAVVKYISSSVDKLNRRLVKFYRYGTRNVQEKILAAPFGVDSNPATKNMVAVYARTERDGEEVIVGFINRNAVADIGELRLFSSDANGNEKVFLWLKNDGKIQLGGNADNLVRYSKLETGLNNEVNAINAQLAAIATAIGSLGGSYTPVNITLNISAAKISELKCT